MPPFTRLAAILLAGAAAAEAACGIRGWDSMQSANRHAHTTYMYETENPYRGGLESVFARRGGALRYVREKADMFSG